VPQWVLKAAGSADELLTMLNRCINEIKECKSNTCCKSSIEKQIDCRIHHRNNNLAVSITSTNRKVGLFRGMVQDMLVSYLTRRFDDHQAVGRLLFDMATNAVGSYKIGRTLNGSVHHQFWFSKDGNNWMQLVELPEALSMETRRILMALLQKIRSHHPGTRIHFYDSRLCDPYVLINGRDRHAVESVAEDVWWCSIATAEHESHVIARHRFMKRVWC
jgi:hypothetical protein